MGANHGEEIDGDAVCIKIGFQYEGSYPSNLNELIQPNKRQTHRTGNLHPITAHIFIFNRSFNNIHGQHAHNE